MPVTPDLNEVQIVARSLGFDLTHHEAALYQRRLADQLNTIEDFLQSDLVETSPPRSSAAVRSRGSRPDTAEDPLNAWLWKCAITENHGGLLTGLTVSYKDTIAVADIPMTCGMSTMDGFVPDFDATVAIRALASGATIVGKNSVAGGFGEFATFPRVQNPHAPDHLAGGTSAGSAVAVVTGEVDVSFGGDQGGSVRIPAAWSGAIGLKPTFGLISHFGIASGSDRSLDHVGPIARRVEHVAVALEAVAGYDGLDDRQGRRVPDSVDVVATLSDGVDGLRVGVLEEGFSGAEPDVADVVEAAIEVLRQAGASISKISIPEHHSAELPFVALELEGSHGLTRTGVFNMYAKTYYPAKLARAVDRAWVKELEQYPEVRQYWIHREFARRVSGGRAYAKAQNVRPLFVEAYDKALSDVDVLVMPTCVMKAPKHDGSAKELSESWLESSVLARAMKNTLQFNYTGHPALAIPCGKSAGLPVSMQIVGRHFDEATLLRVGFAFQHSVAYDEIIAS